MDLKNAIAVYLNKRTGKRTALMPTVFDTMYEYHLDYNGMFAGGATSSFDRIHADLLMEMTKQGIVEWIKTPKTYYHCWHICFCEKCGGKKGGKVKDHSQGTWDSHCKFSDSLFTFPTVD